MNQKLIKKAFELRNRGFTTGEIADDGLYSKEQIKPRKNQRKKHL